MTEAAHRMGRAKATLVIEQPFIATIVCNLPLIEDATLNPPTLATDGNCIWYHPKWVETHTPKELMWALGHETMHCVFKHMMHRGQRHPVKWNRAADYVINQLLELDMKGCRPANVLYDPAIYAAGNGTTEGVYNILPEPDPDATNWDMVVDFKGDPSEVAEAEARWQVLVAQAAATAKAHGRLNSELERFVGELLNPKVPWEEVLRRFCLRQVHRDRSFARPARRHLHKGMYMPGLSGEGMGDILIAFDQSGSVTPTEVQRFASEMNGIKQDAEPAMMHVLYFTDEINKHDQFGADEELVIKPNATGGTRFSPIFAYAEANDIHPDCAVILTDLYAADFGPHPDYPVLWVTTGSLNAPWGEVISIRD